MYRKFLLRQGIPMFKSEHRQCLFLWASSFSQHHSRPIWLLCLWCLYSGLASFRHTCTLGTLRLSINWVEVFRILECCFTLLKTKPKITMNRVSLNIIVRGTKRGRRIIWSICAWDIFGGEINAISVLDDGLKRLRDRPDQTITSQTKHLTCHWTSRALRALSVIGRWHPKHFGRIFSA